MTTRKNIKNFLRNFILKKGYDVALLKGEWGIGKTYLLDELKDEIILKNNKEYKNKFIYVSLFGIENINEVKQKLIYNKNLESSVTSIAEQVEKFSGYDGAVSAIASAVTLYWESHLEDKLTNKIVVFDDIERRGNSLSIISVLGLINNLKSRDNKIIIMINEDQLFLDDENKINKEWKLLKEKIIDIEYRLNITESEFKNYVIKNNKTSFKTLSSYSQSIIEELLLEINTKNIRIGSLIFKRIYPILSNLEKIFSNEELKLLKEKIKNIAKMFNIYFTYNTEMDYDELFLFIAENSQKDVRNYINYNQNASIPHLKELIDSLNDDNFDLESKLVEIIYEYIKIGGVNLEQLNAEFKNIKTNLEQLINNMDLSNFIDDINYDISISNNDINVKIDDFLQKEYINYQTLFTLYEVIKHTNNPNSIKILDKLKDIVLQDKWDVPSVIKDKCPELANIIILQNRVPENSLNIITLISYLSESEDYDYYNKIINKYTKEKIKAELLSYSPQQLKTIIKFLIDIKGKKGEDLFLQFNKSLSNLYKEIINSQKIEDEPIKRIFQLMHEDLRKYLSDLNSA